MSSQPGMTRDAAFRSLFGNEFVTIVSHSGSGPFAILGQFFWLTCEIRVEFAGQLPESDPPSIVTPCLTNSRVRGRASEIAFEVR